MRPEVLLSNFSVICGCIYWPEQLLVEPYGLKGGFHSTYQSISITFFSLVNAKTKKCIKS